MEIISKTAFARRCGVSNTTVFKWIGKNKDGIREYCTPDGIKDSIFSVSPWDQIDTRPKVQSKTSFLRDQLETSRKRADDIQEELTETQAELVEARNELTEMQKQLDVANSKSEELQTEIDRLNGELEAEKVKEEQIRGELAEAIQDAEKCRSDLTEEKHNNELLRKDLAFLKEKLSEKEDLLKKKEDEMEERLREKDGYIAQYYGLLNRPALAPVKKPLGQRIVEFFKGSGAASQDQNS